jgi:hypothetical protein
MCRSEAAFLNVARPAVPVAAAAGLARVDGEYKIKTGWPRRRGSPRRSIRGLEPEKADDTARGGWPGL